MNFAKRKSWSSLSIIGLVLAVIFAGILAFVSWRYWLFSGGVFKTSSFNEHEWKSQSRKADSFSCYRGGMAIDIKTNILRVGQSRSEVEKLLGKPDSKRGTVYEYGLGMCSGLRIDFDTLDVHFSPEGNLTSVFIFQH